MAFPCSQPMHKRARMGRCPSSISSHARRHQSAVGKAVVFARTDVTVGDTRQWTQDASVRDVPQPGERIAAGQPVCTVMAEQRTAAACYEALVKRAGRLYEELIPIIEDLRSKVKGGKGQGSKVDDFTKPRGWNERLFRQRPKNPSLRRSIVKRKDCKHLRLGGIRAGSNTRKGIRMKPSGFVLGLAAFVFVAGAFPGHAADGFDQKLSKDKQVVHVLNRLTFGPRPGDVEDVRRMGIREVDPLAVEPGPDTRESDARRQAEARRKPATCDVANLREVSAGAAFSHHALTGEPVPADQLRKLMSGTIDERRAVIASLTGDTRIQVLGALAPQTFEGLPDVQAEQVKARQAVQAELQKKRRELNPPLNELLSPEQLQVVQRGTSDEKAALLKALDPDKRRQVLRGPQIQPQSLPEPFRREALAARNPQQLVTAELIEGKLYRALYSKRQLEEVLVDFWLNHFNVFNGKGQVRMLLTSYERDAIRPHVFGRFRDMLLATARHPAMLFYLDN